MKLRFLLVVILVIVVSALSFAEMTGRIVVRGKWGPGEGEFGLDTSEPPGAGPSIFTVAPNGDVYVADGVNNQIVVYDHVGKYLRSYKVNGWISSIEVDENGYIYYNSGGLKIINKNGDLIAASKYGGVVSLDRDKIYLIRDGTSDELELNKKANGLRVIREIKETGVGGFIMSSGIEFRRGPSSVSKSTGIAHITINGKLTQVKKRVGRNEEVIRKDSASATGAYSAIVNGTIIDGDDQSNVYLYPQIDCMYRLNAQGIITGEFKPPTKDDQHVIGQLGYAPSGYVRVKNGKIYYMGSTPYDPSRAIRVKRGSTNYLGSPNDEFMIIEYEFQPVGDTVEVENEGDGVKKI